MLIPIMSLYGMNMDQERNGECNNGKDQTNDEYGVGKINFPEFLNQQNPLMINVLSQTIIKIFFVDEGFFDITIKFLKRNFIEITII